MNTVLSVQVSLLTVLKLPVIPSPTTCCRPRRLVWFSLRSLPRGTVFKPSTSRKGLVASWASPFPSWLATTTGRIEFVIRRTDRSPPDALHPASRRRSFVRLQCSNPTLTGTHTPPFQHHHKRTRSGILPHRRLTLLATLASTVHRTSVAGELTVRPEYCFSCVGRRPALKAKLLHEWECARRA